MSSEFNHQLAISVFRRRNYFRWWPLYSTNKAIVPSNCKFSQGHIVWGWWTIYFGIDPPQDLPNCTGYWFLRKTDQAFIDARQAIQDELKAATTWDTEGKLINGPIT